MLGSCQFDEQYKTQLQREPSQLSYRRCFLTSTRLRERALNKVGSERVRSDVLAQPRVRGQTNEVNRPREFQWRFETACISSSSWTTSQQLLGLAFDPVSQSEPSRGTLRPRLESGDSLQAFSPIEDLPFRNAESSLHPTLYRALSSQFQDRSEQPASSLVDSQI